MSITTAKASQAAAKAKAARLCGTSDSQTPFYPEGSGAGEKLPNRVVRNFNKGGKVIGGKMPVARADRKARKAGGRCEADKPELKKGGKVPAVKKPAVGVQKAKAPVSKAAPAGHRP